jgi:hypothetical protein
MESSALLQSADIHQRGTREIKPEPCEPRAIAMKLAKPRKIAHEGSARYAVMNSADRVDIVRRCYEHEIDLVDVSPLIPFPRPLDQRAMRDGRKF